MSKHWKQRVGRLVVTWCGGDTPVVESWQTVEQVAQSLHAELGAMNRDDHFYPSQVFKESCAYQRPQGDAYSSSRSSPPPCLYMSRQLHSVYAAPSMGTLDQAGLPDMVPSYGLSLRDDPAVAQLHHTQLLQPPPPPPPQPPPPPAAGYGDTADHSRYQHLPFPWMKTTKSHAHTWKEQWTGESSLRGLSQSRSDIMARSVRLVSQLTREPEGKCFPLFSSG